MLLALTSLLACEDTGRSKYEGKNGASNLGANTGRSGGAPGSGGSNGEGGSSGASYVVVDQFGYLPDAEKLAVVRDPDAGFDKDEAFTPGSNYELVPVAGGASIPLGAPVAWNGGALDESSGDRAFRVDFSEVTTPGEYYVLDVEHDVRSFVFRIADDVYRDVLKQAVRALYYQRAGQEKTAELAGEGWTDAASHLGPLQDREARLFSDPNNAATARDVSGGWYDAGDLNKYTSWTASYVQTLLRAYVENPAAFSDDYAIPESGNGIADIVDEAKWGLDHLARLQQDDGSALSVVGLSGASPPSAARGPTLYGPPSTSATLASAAAFAHGARVFATLGDPTLEAYARDLRTRAERAWTWAEQHPAVLFRNNHAASGSSGLASGQQEVNDFGRAMLKLGAAIQLFSSTGDSKYQSFVDANYMQARLFTYNNYVSPWESASQDALLEYTRADGATPSVVQAIRSAYLAGANSSGNLGALKADRDPYLSYMKDYVWGSNATKSNTGSGLYNVSSFELDTDSASDFERAAAHYVHYLHGLNPLALVYLTNMAEFGAENSIKEIYHTWFADGSRRWDRVGTSTFGPPPGFLSGGPNPSYNWDSCCPQSCGSAGNNARCGSAALSPPRGQPQQKAYRDFNDAWPVNSWAVSEPSNGYQVAYIRLLSKFVK